MFATDLNYFTVSHRPFNARRTIDPRNTVGGYLEPITLFHQINSDGA
jgi:hypothetical protein